ncbi:mRNA-decapping enzyme subunit-like protein [Hapsidospora chrysogenum ATCC 11550]|uniref:mRNA-decapping enzyme subunit-like protein n=1 Tax=Hapsidospora chrysogenum (strain ATCC 11550 / CBS 779.69 / DSM 880 / IAM 14645 / JCM 23072 / IMI 49137) TaxID=857340 RepID=A0A086SZE3_HAPC1|nr:mRNA-decapping enzyme subunit-like protein [Hapsidospora chrysogenum ATCC 11550]
MSKPTAPRKPRHTRNPSNLIPAVSDYDSDAALIQPFDYAPPPPTRTNTELNLLVLRRYLPSIHTILSIAANAVVYTLDSSARQWEKMGIEGTLFVCAQASLPDDPQQRARACVFVLSRRGLENVIVDLARVSAVEITGELVVLQVEAEWGGEEKVLGLWIHNDRADTRDVNAAMITESWKIAREAGPAAGQSTEVGPAMQAIGSGGLSINDLFRNQNNRHAPQ